MSRITLNFDLPVQNNLRLAASGNASLYRNNAGLMFPYTSTGFFSITGTSATTNPTGFYYFFYDWEFRPESCFSDREAVIATVSNTLAPVASINHQINGLQVQFTNTSTQVTNHFWDFGDGTSAITANPMHIYSTAGSYSVKYLATNDCGADSLIQQITLATGIEDSGPLSAIQIFPNPAGKEVNIRFHSKTQENLSIELYDVSGRLLQKENRTATTGNNHLIIYTPEISSGVYMLLLRGNGNSHKVRLLIGD
jgi:PKD repeat protein